MTMARTITKTQILEYLRLIGVRDYEESSKHIAISCPLARWRHRGLDNNPSCCIYLNPIPDFYCFACHASGTLADLLGDYSLLAQVDLSSAIESLRERTKITLADKAKNLVYDLGTAPDKKRKSILNTHVLTNYPRPFGAAEEYLRQRGVPEETAYKFDIRYDVMQQRLLFPVFDKANQLCGLVGRSLSGQMPKYKNYFGFNSEFVLGGENHVKHTILLVEGFFDVLRCDHFVGDRFSLVCSWGTNFSRTHLSTVLAFDRNLVVCYDNDPAGDSGWQKIRTMAYGQGIKVTRLLPKTDFGDLTTEEFQELEKKLQRTRTWVG